MLRNFYSLLFFFTMAVVEMTWSLEDQLLNLPVETDERICIQSINQSITFDEILLHHSMCGNVPLVKHLVETGANVNAQDNLGKTPIMVTIENKPDGFEKVIEILCKANANIHIADKCGKTAAQLVLGDSNGFDTYVSKIFLKIIHSECMNMSQSTAKKLNELGCRLWQAVLLESTEIIEHMIRYGSQLNSYHPEAQFTALSRAVQLMNLEMVKLLIRYDADADLPDYFGSPPIGHYGSYLKGTIQYPEIVKLLLDKTVSLKNCLQENLYQLKRPFECGNIEVIQMLLEYHPDMLNMKDRFKQTPLHYLSFNYHSGISGILQNHNVDVNATYDVGRTPLFVTARHLFVNIDTVQFLLKNGANVNAATELENRDVPLFLLCRNCRITNETYFKIIQMFLQCGLDVQVIRLNQKTVFDIIPKSGSFYMAKPLLAHLALLEEVKKPILEYIRNKINSHEIYKRYFDNCKVELKRVKNTFIVKNVSTYSILLNEMSDQQIVKCCRFDPNSISKFEELKNNYHYYAIVQERTSSIISKLELTLNGALLVCKLLKMSNNPHHIAVTEIIDYLNDQDLENLIKAEV